MKTLNLIIALVVLISASSVNAQNESIDASKPTNFYSFIDNTFENTSSPGQNVMGYRGKATLAPSESHLILAELPVLYNDKTKKGGIGDIRGRYFYLPYKNYDKLFGSFGPSIDVFAPTGNFKNGLGSGRFIVSPGVTVGIMAADWIQFFPTLSYQYSSKMVQDVSAELENKSTSDITFQVITPIVFSKKFFIQVTPIYRASDFGDARQDRYIQEFFAAYSITQKLQLTGFYNGNFQDKIHQASIGLTVYL